MENSLDETETQQPLKSPPKRRRSTFFARRDSVVPLPEPDNDDTDICKKTKEIEKRVSDMSRYYEKLLQEKEAWKKEANERRNKYHDMRLQYQMVTKASSRSMLSYTALTNEDIEFIKGKPNLAKLAETAQKLHDTTKVNIALVRRANELEDVAVDLCERKVDKIVQHILENSSIESGE